MNTTGNTPQSLPHLRVFLASPGDVADERTLALKVLERLPYDELLHGKVTLEIVAWDKAGARAPLLAPLAPQEAIKEGLPEPSHCEIVIVIFWSRMGTLLPEDWIKPVSFRYLAGTPWEALDARYLSGTEWEYFNALQAYEETQHRPDILVYRRTEKRTFDPEDSNYDENGRQWQLVKAFFQSFHHPDGSLRRAYNKYKTPAQFEEDLTHHLKGRIKKILESSKATTQPPSPPTAVADLTLWKGSPFPGLRSFTDKHAPIFFGRGYEVDGLIRKLADPDIRFIAVVGASGSGKSSLVWAGLIPRLQAGAIEAHPHWTWVRFTPGEVGENPFMALAVGFKPMLEAHGRQVREMAAELHWNIGRWEEWVRMALEDKSERTELLLFIDQFEELFTLVTEPYREPFISLLVTAARMPYVRLVVTLRADFYAACVRPPLAELLRNGFSYTLEAPGPGALYEMITKPAVYAGLVFAEGLPRRLLDDTGLEPGGLALLAFALYELYRVRMADGRLTHAAYDSFGGVKGVIAQRAEETFKSLDPNVQQTLNTVFQELVEVDDRGTATRRRARRSQLSHLTAVETLIDRFTNARLLVTSGKEKQRFVEVAHEALLRSWPRLAEWIETVRDDLRLCHQLQRAAIEWKDRGYPAIYRWSDERVVETAGMLQRLRYQPDEQEQHFLGPTDPQKMRAQVDDLDTSAELRRTIGIRLALLGDTRPGIGVDAEGLPNFRWASIPGTEAVRASGQFQNFTGFRMGNGARLDPVANSDESWPEGAAPLEIKDFELAIYPVTVAQFRPFVEQGGYQNTHYWSKTGWLYRGKGPGWWKNKTWILPNQPVIGVSWYAVQAYCNWLNEQLQLLPGTLRLPTEAEWEWAARGPEGNRYPWGETWNTRRCNSLEAGLDCTSAVDCFPGGAMDCWLAFQSDSIKIYDLAGNVWEWTASEYCEHYSTAPESVLNADHPADCPCVLRGGSWGDEPQAVRGAARLTRDPRYGSLLRGFRLARSFP